jgi:DNA (cytosine-5)-methyltransferase 1
VRPLLLDLFCGAGGAAMGYHRAGFDVVGVDRVSQPHYPFEFFLGDALDVAEMVGVPGTGWTGFAAVHASPPCQAFTKAQRIMDRSHPDLVGPIRKLLRDAGLPYVIENVPGSPLHRPVTLCGLMFGLGVDRDRLFESNIRLAAPPPHPAHDRPKAKMGRPVKPGEVMQVVGHFSGVPQAREAMGIDWMVRDELSEAIPPAYTEWVGAQLIAALRP